MTVRADPWCARIITLFPDAFPGVLGESLTGKALRDGRWRLDAIDLRDFGIGRHRNVDDTPAGGGAGMVLRADVVGAAIEAAAARAPALPLFCFSPRGRVMDQALMRDLAAGPGVTLICGRFEGLDERIFEHYPVQELSLGDFVLTGGEIAAQALIDATVRLLPDVLGNPESAVDESFAGDLLEYPQYTRPALWHGHPIPEVLLSGDHARIARWRRDRAEDLTRSRRPDLWARHRAKQGLDAS